MPDCPICGTPLDENVLAGAGLDKAHLDSISNALRSKRLGIVIDLGEIALKYLHPERLGAEFQVHEALEMLSKRSLEIVERQRDFLEKMGEGQRADRKEILEQHQQELLRVNNEARDAQKKYLDGLAQLSTGLSQIRERIVGPGIGVPGEIVTIKDLKSAFPSDSFSSAKATQGGADIVAEVRDGTVAAGKVVVSVKYENKWKDDFVAQLEKNLRQENTEFAVLVSRVFPSDALNDKAYLTDRGWAIVKPEYAVVAYMGVREAVIHLQRAKGLIRAEEDRARTREHVTSAIREWLSGENFHKTMQGIETAVQASKETDVLVQQWQNYADEKSAKVQRTQQQLRAYLVSSSSLLTDLQAKLEKTGQQDMGQDSGGRSSALNA